MELKIIGSGSKGNAYLLENGEEALLIECGVNFNEIKKALNFSFSKVSGAIVSHSHGDHAKSIKETMAAGINVWASESTHEACGTTMHHRACMMMENQVYKIGNFQIKPFGVKHDVPTFGFYIVHPDCGRVVFITDTKYCEYVFPPLHNIIVEANYSKEIIDKRVADGANPKFLRNRVIHSHLSLENCLEFLKANDLNQVNNIVLIHLSDGNSHEVNFKKAVENITGKNVSVASNGMKINFNRNPF